MRVAGRLVTATLAFALVVGFELPAGSAAQKPARVEKATAERPPVISDLLVAAALALEGEYGAHLLLTLVESGRVRGKRDVTFVVDAALAKTASASEPYERQLATGLDVGSLEGARASALRMFPVD